MKKKKISGSKKGSKFERKLCKRFSLWASKGLADDWFWRTPSSGGRATERIKKGLTAKDYAGDMMSIDIKGRPLTRNCQFEFKIGYSKQQKLSITSLIDKLPREKEPIIISWWKKLIQEVEDHEKQVPLLIFKRDRKEACVVVDSRTWHMDLKFDRLSMPKKYVIIRYLETYLFIFLLEDFFRSVQPKWLCKIDYTTEEVPRLKIRRQPKLKYRRKR